MKLSDKLLENYRVETPYQRVAREFNVTTMYVGMVARGDRNPIRGKGLKIKQRLQELTSTTKTHKS